MLKAIGFLIVALMSLYVSSPAVHAQNIGQYGQVFPVVEEDIRQWIMKRLHAMQDNGELLRHQKEIEQRVAKHIIRPTPLQLPTTKKPKTFRIDPSVVVSNDVWTPEGVLLAKKGMTMNPFNHVTFSKTLFFFNADDAKQVTWARKHYSDYGQVKFILTSGDIREAAIRFGRIYFDLNGLITSQLHVTHVPSVVNQDGLFWKVVEIGEDDE